MKRNTFNLLMALGLVLALGGGIVMARRAQAQGPGPEGPSSIQAAVGTAFTYQGRLVDNSTPVDGTCDFQFNLYDDAWPSPSLVAGPVDRGAVTVSDGYFSTSIDFGASAFNGKGRQLEILVRCPAGSGSYTTLSGMVTLSAVPYAHSLRPGAVINGSVELGSVVKAENTYSGMFASYGLHGVSQDTGILGTGGNTGVQGETASTSGKGVYGYATAGSGTNYGVYGESNSATDGSYGGYFTGYGGVYGKGTGTFGAGVRGESTDEAGGYFTSTNDVGVFGRSENSWGMYGYAAGTSGTTYGVYGRSDSGTGYGVYGYSASNHGVHGKASPPDGYGIYSEGNAYVEGELFWDAKTSYVAVAAAAFHPMGGGYAFSNDGYKLQNTDGSSDYYVASVQLPHGAIVTSLTFYWNDGSLDYDGNCGLYRIDLAGNEVGMATTATNGSAMTPDSSQDTTIDYAAVDNSQYAYYVYWRLPDNAVLGYGAVIEYTFTEPY